MMNPQMLIDPSHAAPLSAPYWFIEFFKMLGFTLHMVPMNLWFAGILVALLLRVIGSKHGTVFSRRLMRQMPVLIALGINFGIVPLLFIQLAYYQFFYPATILMGWFWMAIVVMLIPAYYGIYLYSFGLRDDDPASPDRWRRLVGWGSAVLFILIGFMFVNGLSMLGHPEAWPSVWEHHQLAGAALGTGLYPNHGEALGRWMLMFGLALGTTAAWCVVDAAWFAVRESEAYRSWAVRFGARLALLGAFWFAAAGSWYVYGTWSEELRETMFGWPNVVLTVATALAPGIFVLLFLISSAHGLTRATATVLGVAQLGVLGVNAVCRQVVQNVRVGAYLDLSKQPTEIQWSPLVAFLVLFVLGALVVLWMVTRVVKETKTT